MLDDTVNGEVMDFRLEGFADLASAAGKIDDQAAGIDHVHLKALRPEPGGNSVEVGLVHTVAGAEFLCGEQNWGSPGSAVRR